MFDFFLNTKIEGLSLYELLFWFLIYGVIGWVFESTLKSIEEGRFVNRGFLLGPFIPIYSCGVTLFILFLTPIERLAPIKFTLSFLPEGHQVLKFDYKFYIMFLAGGLICSALEYVVSFVMEKMFHQRWWDYTEYKFNTKGRVCISITYCWGALSIAAIHFIHPLIGQNITDHLPKKLGVIIMFILYAWLLADTIISNIIAKKKKDQILNEKSEQEEG